MNPISDKLSPIFNQVYNLLGGQNMNQGQQMALSQVSSDLGLSPVQIATELAKQQSADTINNSLGIAPTSNQSAYLKGFPITQQFGVVNPQTEVFSKGINTGVDIGVPKNTPVSLPNGKWQVVSAFNGAKGGYIGDNENQGYGNSVVVKNVDTGETLRFSHLSQLNIPSDTLQGGQVIGLSGATGNVTGPHLDVEYHNSKGQLQDFLSTPYAKEVGL